MVVLRPGNNLFDNNLITFGNLSRQNDKYYSPVLYNGEHLYYQFNDCFVRYDEEAKCYFVEKMCKDYEYVEQAIQERLAEDSHNMFKRGFSNEMLSKMLKNESSLSSGHSCEDVSVYTKHGQYGHYVDGESDVIFQCCFVEFEQSSWQVVWKLIQIRQEADLSPIPTYLFVDDEDDEEDEEEVEENGYESSNEQTDENFMFVPKPINE